MAQPPNPESLSRQQSFTVSMMSRGPSFLSQEGLQTEETIEGSIQILSVKSPHEEHFGYRRDSTRFSTRDRLAQEFLQHQRHLGSGATNYTLTRGISDAANTPLQLRVVTPTQPSHPWVPSISPFKLKTVSVKKGVIRQSMFAGIHSAWQKIDHYAGINKESQTGDNNNAENDKSVDINNNANTDNVVSTSVGSNGKTDAELEIYGESSDLVNGTLKNGSDGTTLELPKLQLKSAEKPPTPVTPQPPVEPPPPKKREIIKKEKKVKPAPPPPPKPRTPTPVEPEPTPTPPPVEPEAPVSREISFFRPPSTPKLPPIEVPDLPEIQDIKTESKSTKKERKLIEVTPDLPEQKKKLPPPPKLAPRIKTRQPKRRKVAEAPVTSQELQQLSDPLDFLAKYCIINPDRLPFYERIFNGAVDVQTPRYSKESSPGDMVRLPPAQLSQHEINMLKDLTVITHAQTPRRDGMSVPEQYLEKLNYSIDFIKTKQSTLHDHMHKLQAEKMRLMAQIAKEMDRDIVRVDYKTKGKKKKKDDDESPKKKKKKKSSEPDYDTMGAMSSSLKNFQPTKSSDITDEVIVSRMDDKMLKKAKKDPIVKQFTIEISRDIEKLKGFDQRISQIEDEKDLVGLYCMDTYFAEQNDSQPPYNFRRQQSRLYQKLHPDPDIEMNIDEVETALQQINNKLLSEKEFQYIYFILDLPKREKINFRLFSIIAALSEKVTQMDPVIRKLINKVDYNALDVKMDKSKELFELLQDEDQVPAGNAPADILAVELTAGGLTPEHTSYVLSKFNREGRGFVDFLDFVTYVPLFVDIHKRIIEDPFNECLDI
ncbi:hypothetical protein ACF0H5_022864 [Mactra antiquata]